MPVRGPHAPFVILVLGVVIIGVLGILVLNTKINENAFRLSDLQAQQGSLDQREQQLGAAVAASDAPNSLAVAARKLGLAPARTPAHVKQPTGQGTAAQRPSAAASATAGGH